MTDRKPIFRGVPRFFCPTEWCLDSDEKKQYPFSFSNPSEKSPFPSWCLDNEQNLWQSARLTACHITARLNGNPENKLSPPECGKAQTSQESLLLIAVYNPNNQSFLWKNPLTPPYFLQAGEDPTRLPPTFCVALWGKKRLLWSRWVI